MSDYLHTCVKVDGVPVDLLLTEDQVKVASEAAIEPENQKYVKLDEGSCWPVTARDSKCSLLQWIMGKCCECGECDD